MTSLLNKMRIKNPFKRSKKSYPEYHHSFIPDHDNSGRFNHYENTAGTKAELLEYIEANCIKGRESFTSPMFSSIEEQLDSIGSASFPCGVVGLFFKTDEWPTDWGSRTIEVEKIGVYVNKKESIEKEINNEK